jgi:hypothetical protein
MGAGLIGKPSNRVSHTHTHSEVFMLFLIDRLAMINEDPAMNHVLKQFIGPLYMHASFGSG